MSNFNRTIIYGKEKIDFEVQYRERKTLDISVHPDQHIIVKVPSAATLEKIDQRVKDKARWILKQKEFFRKFEPRTPERLYISGETHLYLGRQYRLKVESSEHQDVKLRGRYIQVRTRQTSNSALIKKLLEAWYLRHARNKFKERLIICSQHREFLEFSSPPLLIRKLSKRWGSLTARGTLILNQDLIRAPLSGIDYVITHELCHLKICDHSSKFYDLLELIMPDWQKRKELMENKLI